MSLLGKIAKGIGKAADWTPGVSNIKGALSGNLGQAAGGSFYSMAKDASGLVHKDPGDAGDIDERTKQADDLRDAYLAERKEPAYQPDRIGVSRADFSSAGPALTYEATDPGAAREYQAALANKGQDVNVGQLLPVDKVQSQGVSGPGAAAIAGMDRVKGANLDTYHADRVQGQQDNYLKALEARSRGEGPSVAENAYSAKMGDIAANAQGIAGQARGSDKAYARLHAMDTIADQGRKAAFESAQLRAGEMDTASNALGSQLGNVRSQDVDTAKTAAQLQQEANLANQRAASSTEQYNSGAINSQNQFNTGVQERSAERAQAASTANATAANARTIDEAQLRATADIGNATRAQQNDQFNAGSQTAASAANAAAANNRGDFRSGLLTGQAKDNVQTINNRYDTDNAARNANAQFNATQAQNTGIANQSAGLTGNAQEINRKAGIAGDANAAMSQGTQMQVAKISKPATPSFDDRLLGAVTAAGPMLMASDERTKKDIKDVDDDAASRLAKALEFKEFKYKDDPNETNHVGVMAQDLEKDPLGRKLVHENDEGVKHVDYSGLTQLLLAAALRGKKEARR